MLKICPTKVTHKEATKWFLQNIFKECLLQAFFKYILQKSFKECLLQASAVLLYLMIMYERNVHKDSNRFERATLFFLRLTSFCVWICVSYTLFIFEMLAQKESKSTMPCFVYTHRLPDDFRTLMSVRLSFFNRLTHQYMTLRSTAQSWFKPCLHDMALSEFLIEKSFS